MGGSPSFRYLAVWRSPRVRSAAAAQELLLHRRPTLRPSPALASAIDRLTEDSRIAREPIIEAAGDAPDGSVATFRVAEDDLAVVAHTVTDVCREAGLSLFDIGEATLVLPATARASSWPRRQDGLLSALKEVYGPSGSDLSPLAKDLESALRVVELSREGKPWDDSGSRIGAVDLSTIPIVSVPLPLKSPWCLEGKTMQYELPKRGRERMLSRLLTDVVRPRRDQGRRRMHALWVLGSWEPSPAVDDTLRDAAANGPDTHTRAEAAMALAKRATGDHDLIQEVARALLSEARVRNEVWEQDAAAVAVLAAVIDAAWSREPTLVASARGLIDELKTTETQGKCAAEIEQALDDSLAAHSGRG